MSSDAPLPAKIFFAYAHEDHKYLTQIQNHLASLKSEGRITQWYDRDITAGKEWNKEIQANLENANIIVLLVSSDFISSSYCQDIEFKRAEELHAENRARVVPIMVRRVYLTRRSRITAYQCLPPDAIPLSISPDLDDALTKVVEGIDAVVEELRGGNQPAIAAPIAPNATQHHSHVTPAEPEIPPRRAAPAKKKRKRKRKLTAEEYRNKCGAIVWEILDSLPEHVGLYLYPDIYEDEFNHARSGLGLPEGEGVVGLIQYTHNLIFTKYLVFGDSGFFIEDSDGPLGIPYWEFDERQFGITPEGLLDLGAGEIPILPGGEFNADFMCDVLLRLQKAFKRSRFPTEPPPDI